MVDSYSNGKSVFDFIHCRALLLLALTAPAAAQTDMCITINEPAYSDFDFTEDQSRWGTKPNGELDGDTYHVRSISINQLPIFDESNPRENSKLYRWINRVHFYTQPEVIHRQLLFNNQDEVSQDIMTESERILRQRRYVGDAKLRVLKKCGNDLDLEVVTREFWTLTPEISLKSAGGENTSKFGIRDSNFLGSGQQISVLYRNDPERNSYELIYKQPNLNDTRILLEGGASNSTDGYRYFAHAALPFFSLDSNFSWDAGIESKDVVHSQYTLGHKNTQVQFRNDIAELSLGFSRGQQEDTMIRRFSGGIRYDRRQYGIGPELPIPGTLPNDMILMYPFVRYETLEDNYAMAYNISQIQRTEDLYVGRHLVTTLGYSPGNIGNLVFNGLYTDTLVYKPRHLLQFSAEWDARWSRVTNNWQDTIVNLDLDYHLGQTDNRTLFMGLSATKA